MELYWHQPLSDAAQPGTRHLQAGGALDECRRRVDGQPARADTHREAHVLGGVVRQTAAGAADCRICGCCYMYPIIYKAH